MKTAWTPMNSSTWTCERGNRIMGAQTLKTRIANTAPYRKESDRPHREYSKEEKLEAFSSFLARREEGVIEMRFIMMEPEWRKFI